MKILPIRLLLLVGIVAFFLFLYSVHFSSSPPTTLRSERLRSSRPKHIYEYQTVVGSAIESSFSSLEVHNCSRMKIPVNIQWNNTYWQKVGDSRIYLYNAFYDIRYTYLKSEYHYIRIIGMSMGKLKRGESYYCSIWYDQQPGSVVVRAEATEVWIQQWDRHPNPDIYHTYLFTCPVPLKIRDTGVYPKFVSISPYLCSDPITLLPVHREGMDDWRRVGGKRQFAVCVKGMDFSKDISFRLIEWLELLDILGADQVFMYKYSVHENIEKVLNYYTSIGRVKVIPLTLPGDQPNDPNLRSLYLKRATWQKRRNELIPYNDCLYRNIYLYDYIIPLDIDEVIIPVKTYTWSEMLEEFLRANPKALNKYASFSAQNAYFLSIFNSTKDPSLPMYFHMLQHTTRSANFSVVGHSVKSFVSTRNSRSVFNHYTLESLFIKMKSNKVLNTTSVQMNHYKERCPREMYSQCKSKFLVYTKEDNIINKYREQLVPKVKSIIQEMGIMIP